MSEQRIRDNQTTQNQNKTQKGKKKSRRYLKKSVRRTAGALLLTTALIVAAIPVSDAQALTPDDGVENNIPDLDTIIAGSQYYHIGPTGSECETSVLANLTNKKLGFPYLNGSQFETVYDAANTPHSYYEINMNNMRNAYPVPVYELGTYDAGGGVEHNCISRYIGGGGKGYSPQDDTIDLGDIVVYLDSDLDSDKDTEEIPKDQYFDKNPSFENPNATRYSEYCMNIKTDQVPEGYQVLRLDIVSVKFLYDDVIDPVTNEVTGHTPRMEGGNHAYEVTSETDSHYMVRKSLHNQSQIYYIADSAFEGTTNFNTIKIPSGIYKIGDRAFKGCSGLNTVDLSTASDITFLGIEAFSGCTSLRNVTFKDETALRYIGDGAFAKTGIATIKLPHSATSLGSAVFYGCESLNDAYLPDGSKELTSGIFSAYDSNYEPIIGDYFFANCKGMTASKLPIGTRRIGVGDMSASPKVTGYGVYAGCENLLYVDMPVKFGDSKANQSKVSQEFFSGCRNLKWVRFFTTNATATDGDFTTENNKEFNHHTGKTPNVPNSFAIWGPDPDTTPNIYKYAIENSNTYMYYDQNDNKFKYILVQGGYRFEFDETGKVTDCEYDTISPVEDTLSIPRNIGDMTITELGDSAFKKLNQSKPKDIVIPDTVKAIGNYCFSEVGAIENVSCDTTGVRIGNYAFANNPKLETFKFAQTNGDGGETTLGEGCFMNDPSLTFIAFRDDTPYDMAYYDVNITAVGDKAFYTTGPNLTMLGKMEVGYAPYDFAINGSSKFNNKVGSHILYESGNPQNLSCQYIDASSNDKPGHVSLISFPDRDTIIDEDTGLDVNDIWDAYKADPNSITYNQLDILNYTKDIKIPKGITHFDIAKADVPSTMVGTYKEYDAFKAVPGLESVTFNDSVYLPDNLFMLPGGTTKSDLYKVIFNGDVIDLGKLPFLVDVSENTRDKDNNVLDTTVDNSLSQLNEVTFNGESTPGTPENPRYYCVNGVIYADFGDDVSIEECLSTRGAGVGQTAVNSENDPDLAAVSLVAEGAFYNCDHIMDVNLSDSEDLRLIPDDCFSECDNLLNVELNANIDQIEDAFQNTYDYITVTIPAKEIDISDTAFSGTSSPTLKSYAGYASERYVNRMNKKGTSGTHFNFVELDKKASLLVKFLDYDGTVLKTQTVEYEKNATPPEDPVRDGYTFSGWKPSYLGILDDTTCIAQYVPIGSSSSSSSSSGSSTGTSSKPSGPTGNSSSSSSSSSNGNGNNSSSSTTKIASPIILSGTNPLNPSAPVSTGSGSGSSGNGGSGKSGGSGRTSVQSNLDGVTDVGKMSATVNGSSDNYVVKITQTQEATDMAIAALKAAYGDIEPIRYLPMDISLYDSTGTNKISPIPAGTSVSITMPIPDDLAIYGGNAKVASTVDGKLEKMQPRFTVINSVPCMTFTCTHFSPYVIYVDTANLTEAGIADSTPKTADPIHPKWFLCIGLVAVAILLFIKRDPEEYLMRKARG